MKNLLFDFTVDKSTHTVYVTREFAAEQSLVWDAFTKQDILDRWWAPLPWVSKTKHMEFKVGGKRFYAMVSPEGEEHWAIQEYTAISPKTSFKYLNAFADKNGTPNLPGSDWDLTFNEEQGITTVSITIYNESLERMEQMIEMGFKEGFTMTLEELDRLLTQELQTPPTITVTATVRADRQRTWNFYTQPEHITKWNFASDDWECPSASNDMRVGGTYRARMEAKDGSFGFDFEAVYDEVIHGEKFTYTLTDGRKVEVIFRAVQGGTEVVVTFDAESENSLELQREGWQAILNNFKSYAEAQ